MKEKIIPYPQAVLWIFLSTLAISGSAFLLWFYHLHLMDRRISEPHYNIVSIEQGSLNGHALKTDYLMELLDLPFHKHTNLYRFNLKEAKKKLISSPLIKEGIIQKKFPGTLSIAYKTREPIAYLQDYPNMVLDEQGYVFPFHPFYTPKFLPTIYLGLEKQDNILGYCLKEEACLETALTILQAFKVLHQEGLFLTAINASKKDPIFYGQKEIILTLEEKKMRENTIPLVLSVRLSTQRMGDKILQIQKIYQWLLGNQVDKSEPITIDMRLADMAFIPKKVLENKNKQKVEN